MGMDSRFESCEKYMPSDFAKANLIYLLEAGSQRVDDRPSGDWKNASYLFFRVRDGLGKLEYDGSLYMLSTGYCAFLDCCKSYAYYAVNGTMTIDYIYFDGFCVGDIYKEYLQQGGFPCFRPHGWKVYERKLQQIYDLSVASSGVKEMEIYGKITALLALLMKDAGNVEKQLHSKRQQDLQKVKRYLEQNYQEKITLSSLAEQFYIDKFYLARLFREQFGTSVNQYLIQVRIDHAKGLLSSSNLSINRIGECCGMENTNYFCRIFKKNEGMSPGEFRKKKEQIVK